MTKNPTEKLIYLFDFLPTKNACTGGAYFRFFCVREGHAGEEENREEEGKKGRFFGL